MKILITGAAGFIGMHTAERLLANGHDVVGIDNLNDYYDVNLKQARLDKLAPYANFSFRKIDIADYQALSDLFAKESFQRVIHLAAQAGVRYSIDNPHAYAQSNLVGFVNILESCRHHQVDHLVYASSSSVYGGNMKMPFAESDSVDHPVSLYAATKKSNELMAHTYSHLFGLPTTGLRFFTVYGPWGRPDMAYFKFTKAILEGRMIDVYNDGNMQRDFTYIDDIVEGVLRIAEQPAAADLNFDAQLPDPATSNAPYRVLNIGNHQPVALMEFVRTIELALGKKAEIRFLPMQDGDVVATYADVSRLTNLVDFMPKTPISTGIQNFVTWYTSYYQTGILE